MPTKQAHYAALYANARQPLTVGTVQHATTAIALM
jgi:hypothetical protein